MLRRSSVSWACVQRERRELRAHLGYGLGTAPLEQLASVWEAVSPWPEKNLSLAGIKNPGSLGHRDGMGMKRKHAELI